jgi:cytochrome c-type biogenesis protein CcmE
VYPVRRWRSRIIIMSIPLVISFALLGYIGLYSSTYISVSELAMYTEPTKVSVMGNVTKGSVRIVEGHLEFLLTDGVSYVKVVYPTFIQLDNSTNYAQVTVHGIYYPDRDVIEATEILFKCPSKQQMKLYSETE